MSLRVVAMRKAKRRRKPEVDAMPLNADEIEPSSGDLYNRDSPTLGPAPGRLWKKAWEKIRKQEQKRNRRQYDRDRKEARKI